MPSAAPCATEDLTIAHQEPDDCTKVLIDSLQAPWPERVVRIIRAVMGTSATPVEHVRLIGQTATELGLEPSPPPVALPEITEDDVHLICWLAIVAPVPGSIAEQMGELPVGDRL